eukprot:scaffold3188_cov198-Pinguiococcus_pyrenoidosus.AAC.2
MESTWARVSWVCGSSKTSSCTFQVIVASAGGAAYAAVRYSQGKLKLDLESLPYFNKLAAKEK